MSGPGLSGENEPIPLDPIDPTEIAPGVAAIPLGPTVWDDMPDGQHAVTPNGIVLQLRRGLWYMDPWWQNNGGVGQIAAICANPDEWAYDLGWPRKMVEDAHGPLTPIALPGVSRYPHDDARCDQDSVDAEGFRDACRHAARLADALGLGDHGYTIGEVVDEAIRRLIPPAGEVRDV